MHSHLAGSDYGLTLPTLILGECPVTTCALYLSVPWFSGSSGQVPPCWAPLHTPLIAPG